MTKNMKLGLLPAAVTAALLSGNAMAGTEACFEVYNSATVQGHTETYQPSACVTNGSGTDATNQLFAQVPSKVAAEAVGPEFDGIDFVSSNTQIVYIPTTDIPGGSVIEMELNSASMQAVFANENNIIHLIKYDGTDYEAVASTDGQVFGQKTIKFITKSGTTIGAGTRLAFSRIATGLEPVAIDFANQGCITTDIDESILVQSTSAISGGTGIDIKGGVSKEFEIVDVRNQYEVKFNVTEGEVNAESSSSVSGNPIIARSEFVYDATEKTLTNQKDRLIAPVTFTTNTGFDVEAPLTAATDFKQKMKLVGDQTTAGEAVRVIMWDDQDDTTGDLTNRINFEPGATDAVPGKDKTYETLASTLFPASGDNVVYYALTNTVDGKVMNFNYSLVNEHELDFNSDERRNRFCGDAKQIDVGVNGAVLKVPYIVRKGDNWVRIANEHDQSAEISVEILDDSSNIAETVSFTLPAMSPNGKEDWSLGAYDQAQIGMPQLMTYAAQQGYVDSASATTHMTVTFVVTAPREKVHGVANMNRNNPNLPGGQIVPVLDKNTWSQ
ncbi:hypothetical protein [Vibrio parahaemolyticus]|uniref:hypothetical protein n=1 Tax=Vibrio parahaemolyticus TaxID=670 RepID=UPI00111F8F57|nr:hypothetical protein [Vibrio parahaemolyticus]TOP56131.1 hypothetical protein CGH13_24045 [Vibrio parahaemolyticus]